MSAQTITTAMPEDWEYRIDSFAAHESKGGEFEFKVWPYIGHIVDRVQPGIVRGGGRSLVSMPPQHGKSELLSRWLVTWFLKWNPTKKVILCSYAANVAARWGAQVRDYFDARGLLNPKKTAANDWELKTGGGMVTAGVGGQITSRGADLLIMDDPHKNWDEAHSPTKLETLRNWFVSTFYTRQRGGASVVVIQTRWQQGDLIGWLQDEKGAEGWQDIRIPAIAERDDPIGRAEGEILCPAMFSAAELALKKETLGRTMFAGMYQQDPEASGGNIWDTRCFRYWRELPDNPWLWLQSWDMGFKESGDSWVVGQVWCAKDAGRYLVHQVRGHWGFTTTLEAMKALGMAYPQTMGLVLIEDKANGPALMDVLRRSVPGLIAVEPAGSKLARALSVQGTIEAGNVWLPHHAPWVPGYIKECGLFPSATHDDQVDTTSQALQRMNNQPRFHIGVL